MSVFIINDPIVFLEENFRGTYAIHHGLQGNYRLHMFQLTVGLHDILFLWVNVLHVDILHFAVKSIDNVLFIQWFIYIEHESGQFLYISYNVVLICLNYKVSIMSWLYYFEPYITVTNKTIKLGIIMQLNVLSYLYTCILQYMYEGWSKNNRILLIAATFMLYYTRIIYENKPQFYVFQYLWAWWNLHYYVGCHGYL